MAARNTYARILSVVLRLRADCKVEVEIERIHIGQTPIEHRLQQSNKPVKIEFSRKGYRTEIRTVAPAQDNTITVTLEKNPTQILKERQSLQ